MSDNAANQQRESGTTPVPSNLFSETEQKQLQTFLDGLEDPGQMGEASSSSPTPVLLSSPYSTNTMFSSTPTGQISLLPIPESSAASSSSSSTSSARRRTTTPMEKPGKVEKRKYRVGERVRVPSPSSLSSDNFQSNEDSPKPRGSGRGRKPPHELLSDAQKKANHIASEQKRRANIRIGFDQLVDIVPTLSHCHRSESLILQKSADYIRQLVDTKNSLRERVRELQLALGDVPDEDSSEGELDYAF
ncbi:hypothetical protein BJV82DRAFT_576456 [Fennellomyces sp. T-0311]|nr:hypothetical protein BJV82DRAFT_576456 [Fennellomyces sp. T-0311]